MVALLCPGARTHAQTPPPPPGAQHGAAPGPAAVEEAKRHFQQGVALYNDGDFSGALAEFEGAYRSHPTPGVLYNIGLTLKSLRRYSESIAKLEQYLQQEQKLTSERRSEVQQLITEMRALLADVTIYIVPDGASVLLDGRTIGTSPLRPVGIPAGNHVIEVTADGFQPARKEVIVTAGVPMAIELKLAPIPKTGKVHVTASQPMARVFIDKKEYGFAPIDAELGIGGHQLEVSVPGYQVSRSELVVAGGQTRDVAVTLELPAETMRPPKFYEKWWFWTIAGVVVVGGTAAGIAAASSTQGPIKGTLDPGAQPVN
jgi:hypothetical protein